MRRLAIVFGAILALLVIALVLAPRLVSLEPWKPEIVARAKDLTGRDLRVDGPMRFSVFPRIELALDDVGLSNAPGADPAEMITLDRLRLALELRPLLSGDFRVERFVLERPSIAFAIDADGRRNWAFESRATPASGEGRSAGPATVRELRVNRASIVDGRISWTDRRTGATHEFDAVNLDVSLAGFDGPLEVHGDLVWRSRTVEVVASIASPRALAESGRTAVTASVDAPSLRMRVDHAEAGIAPPALEGRIDLDVESVRDVAAWLGTSFGRPDRTFRAFAVRGVVNLSASNLAIRDADIAFDDIRVSGSLGVDATGDRPRFEGSLASDRLDLRPYLPADAPASNGSATDGWSDEPIVFDGLGACDAALEFQVGRIDVSDLRLDKTSARVGLAGGRLAVEVPDVALYGGSGNASFRIDGSQPGAAALEMKLELSGFRAESLLQDVAGLARLSGTGRVEAALSTRGRSLREMVGALGGTSRIDLRDGTIRGINLVGMVTHVTGAFERSDAAKTDFASMAASFRISSGVARTNDLALVSPLLHVEGTGTVDLPKKSLDLRISPKFVAPAVGQLGLGTPGVSVPVLIRGPWRSPLYLPDLAGMVRGGLEVPVDMLKGVVELPGNLLGGTQPASGAKKGPAPEATPPEKKMPSLRSLFGR